MHVVILDFSKTTVNDEHLRCELEVFDRVILLSLPILAYNFLSARISFIHRVPAFTLYSEAE